MKTTNDRLAQSDVNPSRPYEPPRIISHSAKKLDGMTIKVDACTSAFGAGKSAESDEKDDQAVTY